MGQSLRIGILADWLNPVIEETLHQLRQRGARVEVIYPEQEFTRLTELQVEYDLYLLKSGTDRALSLGGALHMLGAATLNPYPIVAMMRNKIIVTCALEAAGVPVPESFIATTASDLEALLAAGPLIYKPYRGSRGQGISIIRSVADLASLPSDQPLFVQRYHPSDGRDHKIFRIGDQLFGQRRIWPLRSYTDKVGEPFVLTSDLQEIALRCGDVFGIDLYGIDIVVSQGQPYVVDMNKFGSFVGVPDSAHLLAEYLLRAGRRGGLYPRDESDQMGRVKQKVAMRHLSNDGL
jgi:ribosomal protein S6--L-glutamate ligase